MVRKVIYLNSGVYHLPVLCDPDLNSTMHQLTFWGNGVVMYDLGTFKMYDLTWGDSSVGNMLAVQA